MSAFGEPRVSFISTEEQLNELSMNNKLSVVFFWAAWHEPSKPGGQMDQLYRSFSLKYGSIAFASIEAESFPLASEKFEITVVPTFVGLAGKRVIGKVEGVLPADLDKLLKNMGEIPTTQREATIEKTQDTIEDRLTRLVNSAPVMLFMKGVPDAPRCGFSRKIVDILKSNGIAFASFDILGDNEVREGLKKKFEWPTYPQLYVSGQLMGGLDIVVEMANTGDLKEQLGISNMVLSATDPEIALNKRLHALINQSPVVLFMKGSPDNPKCGFSSTIVQILREEVIPFDSFDIFSDEEVRQGLKKLSDWPTYPQLYVKGQLVGGLDIVKEMRTSGPLKEQLLNE